MTDDEPMMGSGDLPLAVGRYWQAPTGNRLRMPNGRLTEPHRLYLIGLFPGSDDPVVCAGPFRNDHEVGQALRSIVLQPAAHPSYGGKHGCR